MSQDTVCMFVYANDWPGDMYDDMNVYVCFQWPLYVLYGCLFPCFGTVSAYFDSSFYFPSPCALLPVGSGRCLLPHRLWSNAPSQARSLYRLSMIKLVLDDLLPHPWHVSRHLAHHLSSPHQPAAAPRSRQAVRVRCHAPDAIARPYLSWPTANAAGFDNAVRNRTPPPCHHSTPHQPSPDRLGIILANLQSLSLPSPHTIWGTQTPPSPDKHSGIDVVRTASARGGTPDSAGGSGRTARGAVCAAQLWLQTDGIILLYGGRFQRQRLWCDPVDPGGHYHHLAGGARRSSWPAFGAASGLVCCYWPCLLLVRLLASAC